MLRSGKQKDRQCLLSLTKRYASKTPGILDFSRSSSTLKIAPVITLFSCNLLQRAKQETFLILSRRMRSTLSVRVADTQKSTQVHFWILWPKWQKPTPSSPSLKPQTDRPKGVDPLVPRIVLPLVQSHLWFSMPSGSIRSSLSVDCSGFSLLFWNFCESNVYC